MKVRHHFIRFAALLMLLPAAFGHCHIPASAEDYPPDTTVFACSNVTGYAGESVMVSVEIPQNTGFTSFSLAIDYPPESSPEMREDDSDEIKRKKGEAAEDLLLNFGCNLNDHIIGVSGLSVDPCQQSGTLFHFWLTIPEDAKPETVYPLRLTVVNCYGITEQGELANVRRITLDGSITVADPNRKGDLNRDGKISVADAVLLNRLLAEELPEPLRPVDEYDLNDDGLLTVTDLQTLLKSITSES